MKLTSEEINNIYKEINNEIILSKSTLGYQQKNLIKNITSTTQTLDGVTFNVNSDNTITINGTSTSRYCDFYIYGWYNSTSTVLSKTGDYTISMGDNFANSGIVAYIIVNGTWAVKEFTTSPTNYTITDNTSTHITCLMIRVPEGVTVNNITVYPMIRYSFITDNTYEPYVDNINARIIENKSDIKINETTLGYTKKNLFKPIYKEGYSGGWGGKLFTFNSDGSITVSGTATAEMAFGLSIIYLDVGNYIISSNPGFNLQLYLDGSYISGAWVSPEGVEISITTAGNYEFKWWHGSGTSVSTTIYPMIRYDDITDDTYEPYIDSVDERLNNIENNLKDDTLLYSGAPSTPNATITIDGLFTNYSVISIIAIVGDFAAEDSYRSATVSLSSIKTQSMTSDDFNIKYVDDNNINIFSGMYSGAPSYVSLKIYAIR